MLFKLFLYFGENKKINGKTTVLRKDTKETTDCKSSFMHPENLFNILWRGSGTTIMV